MSEDKDLTIYGVDLSSPTSETLKEIRNVITVQRGKLQDISSNTHWSEHMDHIVGCLSCSIAEMYRLIKTVEHVEQAQKKSAD